MKFWVWFLVLGTSAWVLLACVGFAKQSGTAYNAKYATPTVTMPLYGAGFTEGQAAPDDDRLKKIEEKLDRLIELLTRLAEAEPQAQPGPQLYLKVLPQEDQTAVARRVEKGSMPPPDSGLSLTPQEVKWFSDFFRGKKLTDAGLAGLGEAAGKTCTQCHSPAVDYKKKGGGFLLFDTGKDQK
jgi:hypothetical protein